jgi:hypothetical protein
MQTRSKKPSTEINNVKRATLKMDAAYIKLSTSSLLTRPSGQTHLDYHNLNNIAVDIKVAIPGINR